MANEDYVEIPVDVGNIIKPDDVRTVAGAGTRLVPMVPIDETGKRRLPCVWKSHDVTTGQNNQGEPIRVHECLLLATKHPPSVVRAEVEVDAWKSFPTGPIEW